MAVFRAELIADQVEFADRILNHRLQGTGDRDIVVVHAIDGEVVVAGTIAADGSALAGDTAGLRRSVGEGNGKVQRTAAQNRIGQINNRLCLHG